MVIPAAARQIELRPSAAAMRRALSSSPSAVRATTPSPPISTCSTRAVSTTVIRGCRCTARHRASPSGPWGTFQPNTLSADLARLEQHLRRPEDPPVSSTILIASSGALTSSNPSHTPRFCSSVMLPLKSAAVRVSAAAATGAGGPTSVTSAPMWASDSAVACPAGPVPTTMHA